MNPFVGSLDTFSRGLRASFLFRQLAQWVPFYQCCGLQYIFGPPVSSNNMCHESLCTLETSSLCPRMTASSLKSERTSYTRAEQSLDDVAMRCPAQSKQMSSTYRIVVKTSC